MKKLEEALGYEFKNKNYLQTALTHSSYANEHRCRSYERLEFLGDSVLSIIVSDYLFDEMRNNDEGDLSRIRASLVCEESLAKIARNIKLGEFLLLGNGEEKSGSRERASILSDVFESVLAAVYLDSNLETARKYILNLMQEQLQEAVCNKKTKDYKTTLQEAVQRKYHGRTKIVYTTIDEQGPEHMKKFVVELSVNDKKVSVGEGKSKKEAEQNAAMYGLDKLNLEYNKR